MKGAVSLKIFPALALALSLLACGGAAATARPLPTSPASTASPTATPTTRPATRPPETTPVVVWPSLAEIEPSVAAPGEEVQLQGLGGLTKLTTAEGRVTGHLESARSFDLYFDGEPAGSFVCQTGACRGSLTVPGGASPGSHQISVEGGSSRHLTVTGSSAATPDPAPASTVLPTPTPGPYTGTPGSTEVTIWPSLSKIEPSVAAPGEEVRVEGTGGHAELRAADGTVTGYIESARSFYLYFDDEPFGSLGCYVNVCRGALVVPDGASPGGHQISIEGGSTRSLTVAAASTTLPPPATPTFPAATIAPEPFALLTTAFPDAGAIPLRYSCDGEDISPALSWTSPPPGTATFALIMDDPDAPGGTWDHWTVFNIPAGTLELPEGEPTGGGVPGSNSWGETGYGGPCPPSGPAHEYRFFLYALDRSLDLSAGASKESVQGAMAGHVLAESTLTGSYGR